MAKEKDDKKDMFAMGFDELVKSVDANTDKPADAEADQKTVEPKSANEHESNMINAFDDSTQALTDDLKVDPAEDEPEDAPALSDEVVQDDSPVDINVFGQTPKQEKDAPEEFNNLKQVTSAVSEDAKPAAHGKIFGDSSSVHTPSKPHGKVFGGPIESKPAEKQSHGKDFSTKVEQQKQEQPKETKSVETPKVEKQEKPKIEKSEAKPAKKTKTTRKAKAVESKDKAMKDETKVIVNDDNIEITLPLNAKVIGLLGKDGVTDALSKAVKDFNASASKELQSAATKELKTLF